MNIKQFENNLKNVQKLTPQVYKKTMQVCVPFYVLHKKLYDEGETLILQDFSINQSELDVLSTLYYMGGDEHIMSPTKLYEVMLFSSGGMTKLLNKLESRGLILRVQNKNDKRSKLVKISDLGIETTIKALKNIVAFEDKYFSKLDSNEQKILQKLLYKMLD